MHTILTIGSFVSLCYKSLLLIFEDTPSRQEDYPRLWFDVLVSQPHGESPSLSDD